MKINSTFITEATYKEVVLDVLDIKFKTGKTYRYYDIPSSIYERFMKSKSKGTFFREHIKDKFFFEQL